MQMSEVEGNQAVSLAHGGAANGVKVIAVTGGKGGVGKTAIAANLAVGLAQRGRRVMLMDADLGMANLDVVLGLQPRHTLAQVLDGRCRLEDVILEGPEGISFIPAASGEEALANLGEQEIAGLIAAFDELPAAPEVLVLDTAAGLSTSVVRFAQAANEVLVVLCDEPASMTDAYALVKVLNRQHGVERFRIVTNLGRRAAHGADLFDKFARVAGRFLDVSLDHVASIPADEYLQRAVQQQAPVLHAFPGAWSSIALKKLVDRADNWNVEVTGRGGLEFFLQRSFRLGGEAPAR